MCAATFRHPQYEILQAKDSPSLIAQSSLNSCSIHAHYDHYQNIRQFTKPCDPNFGEFSQPETQFIGTARGVCAHFHLCLSQVSALTSYEFVFPRAAHQQSADPLNVPVPQWHGACNRVRGEQPSAWRRQCLIKTWSITLIYCLEAGTSKPQRRTAWNHQISGGN